MFLQSIDLDSYWLSAQKDTQLWNKLTKVKWEQGHYTQNSVSESCTSYRTSCRVKQGNHQTIFPIRTAERGRLFVPKLQLHSLQHMVVFRHCHPLAENDMDILNLCSQILCRIFGGRTNYCWSHRDLTFTVHSMVHEQRVVLGNLFAFLSVRKE